MEAQIERLKKYQDKVKTTIKPYLQQLKDYAASLHLQIQNMNKDLDIRDSQIQDLERKILLLKEEQSEQCRFYEMNQNELVASFEKTKQDLNHEIRVLLETNQALQQKSQNLDRALERQDELENLVVALRRSKDDFQAQFQQEMENLKVQNRELRQGLTETQLGFQDAVQNRDHLREDLRINQSRKEELEEQLTSLRYMWTAKSEENEKMKITIASLEKINLELSSKLNELRKPV